MWPIKTERELIFKSGSWWCRLIKTYKDGHIEISEGCLYTKTKPANL